MYPHLVTMEIVFSTPQKRSYIDTMSILVDMGDVEDTY